MSCKYLTTGSLECVEDFTNINAKLGEDCTVRPCAQGTCVAPYGIGRGAYCYNIIKKGDTGCEKSFTTCAQGFYCQDNTCVLDPNFEVKVRNKRKVYPVEEKTSEKEENNKPFLVTLSLYILLGLLIVIVLGTLMYIVARNFG